MAKDLDTCTTFHISRRPTGVVKSGSVESLVYGHRATLVGKYVVVWGGYSKGPRRLYLYNHASNEWQALHMSNSVASKGAVQLIFLYRDLVYAVTLDRQERVVALDMVLLKHFDVVPTKNMPNLRAGSAGAFLESRRELVLLGGGDMHLNVLNMDSKVWRIPVEKGRKPAPRAHHACCSYKSVLYFAGGALLEGVERELTLYMLTVEERSYTWSKPKTATGYYPRNRFMLTLTCSSPKRIFAFGGLQGKRMLDMFVLDSEEACGWHSIEATAVRTGSGNHAAVQTKDFILLLGGYGFNLPRPFEITPRNQ